MREKPESQPLLGSDDEHTSHVYPDIVRDTTTAEAGEESKIDIVNDDEHLNGEIRMWKGQYNCTCEAERLHKVSLRSSNRASFTCNLCR